MTPQRVTSATPAPPQSHFQRNPIINQNQKAPPQKKAPRLSQKYQYHSPIDSSQPAVRGKYISANQYTCSWYI